MTDRILTKVVVMLLLFFQVSATAAPIKKRNIRKTTLPLVLVKPEAKPALPKLKLNAQLGFNVVTGSAVISGFQLGRLIYSKFPIYMGPEINFMMFSPGSVLNTLWGGWIESRIFSDPRKSIDFGLFAGAGFANQRSELKTTNPVLLFDMTYSQEMEDFLTLRGQIRPGIIGGKVVCNALFNAQFRIP